MQGLIGVFSLRSQIAAQERRNMDLAASYTGLKKANADLSTESKELSSKLTELKSKNEELEENYAELVQANAKLVGEMDVEKDDQAKERDENSGLRRSWK